MSFDKEPDIPKFGFKLAIFYIESYYTPNQNKEHINISIHVENIKNSKYDADVVKVE